VTANATIDVSGSAGLLYGNVSAPASLVGPHHGAHWSGALAPSLPPTIDSITPTVGPAEGFLVFNGGTLVNAGDDTISNFSLGTPFYYGGEPYTRIGIVSNGYVVIGGGTGQDVVFSPQTFPNVNRPNNVVAPLWNDLNPAGGGGAGQIRIAVLTDGSSQWLFITYNGVKNFSNSTTHSMQLWFRLATGAAGTGPGSEQVTITYGAANTASPDPGSGGNSGAENRTGTSGRNLATPADNTEWAVNTSPPQAGGAVSFTYDASAGEPGSYNSVAGLTSDVTPGLTQVVQGLTVTP
jgi:hypothetical protein